LYTQNFCAAIVKFQFTTLKHVTSAASCCIVEDSYMCSTLPKCGHDKFWKGKKSARN